MPAPLKLDSVTLIVKDDPLTPVDDFAGLLIESSPDAGLPFDAARQVPMSELLGSFDDAKRRAWQLTQKLFADEQPLDGVLQLRVSEEIFIHELESIFLAIHLDRWLRDHQVRECRFRAASPFIECLREIQRATSHAFHIEAPPHPTLGKFEKARRLVRAEGRHGVHQAAILAARHFFPNGARYLSSLKHGKRQARRGGWWFYSTAHTFTNIGLAYEPYLPAPLNFLCEDAATGGVPLRDRHREFGNLYAFASLGDIPRQREIASAQRDYKRHLSSVSLSGDEAVARQVLTSGLGFQTWQRRILPLTWFHARIFRRWISDTKPEAIVVGNAAYEGVLLQLARAAGVRTILLQHGILGDYYQLMDFPTDTLVVRGEFWREFVSPQIRPRTCVLNIPYSSEESMSSGPRGAILFLTSVESALPYAHASDLRDILTTLLEVAARESTQLVVRVHPRESAVRYRQTVSEICSQRKLNPSVEFSKGPGLEDLLRRTSVAVTYYSTVFLDCVRLGVPVVSFGWHDFSFRKLMERYQVFHFAHDFHDLGRVVSMGARGELSATNADLELFLAPTAASSRTP